METAVGDPDIRAHADLVFQTCLRITGNEQDATDVSQEVFIAWLGSQGAIRGPVGAWLHGTARLQSLAFLRRAARRAHYERSGEIPLPSGPIPGLRLQVDDALAELDESSRTIVIEHLLMGVDQKHLAERFRCTQATVSRRISKALERLRRVSTSTESETGSAFPDHIP